MPQNLDGSAHTEYHVERSRANVSGLIAMPVAGTPPQSVVFARLHSDYTVETIVWGAVREGAPPEIPSPEMLNSNYTLMSSAVSAIVPIPLPNGALAYSVAGTYVYQLTSAKAPTAQFPLGKLPFQSKGADEEYIPAVNFRTDLLGQNE